VPEASAGATATSARIRAKAIAGRVPARTAACRRRSNLLEVDRDFRFDRRARLLAYGLSQVEQAGRKPDRDRGLATADRPSGAWRDTSWICLFAFVRSCARMPPSVATAKAWQLRPGLLIRSTI
jgi:hypothetical protein